MKYIEKDLLKLAKRFNNKKRNYLLVNPLQAKHIPVSPEMSLMMMHSLGEIVAKNHPTAKLVIGFAETATAIGAVIASSLGSNCTYIHTTRENFIEDENCIEFNEEHSHAVEQKLYNLNLKEYLKNTTDVILVDDELSTGKTIINIVEQLKKRFPEISDKTIVATSIINRLTEKNSQRLHSLGIECECLMKMSEIDYTKEVDDIPITAPINLLNTYTDKIDYKIIHILNQLNDPRFGVNILDYKIKCENYANEILSKIKKNLSNTDNVLILGTEEYMYPAIVFGETLQSNNLVNTVKCHATTRSPIGVYTKDEYPIKNGYMLHSFYDNKRETYIYNLTKYDKVIIVSDTTTNETSAMNNIGTALNLYGNNQLFFIKGDSNV